jgi:predicted enzyme related to lactoylglutathione lyase
MEMPDNNDFWNPLVPELTVTDLNASLVFYKTAGFSVKYRREAPPFAYIALGGAQIMLEQQHDEGWNIEPLDRPLGRGVNFQISVADADAVHKALVSMGTSIFRQPSEVWYPASDMEVGKKEFLVQDPDGYLIRFSENLGCRERKHSSADGQLPG